MHSLFRFAYSVVSFILVYKLLSCVKKFLHTDVLLVKLVGYIEQMKHMYKNGITGVLATCVC